MGSHSLTELSMAFLPSSPIPTTTNRLSSIPLLSQRRCELKRISNKNSGIPRRSVLTITGDFIRLPVIPATQEDTRIRPRTERLFSVPYDDLVIRAWQPHDRDRCIELIGSVLAEYGLQYNPQTADRDVVEVETAYQNGEFWVVEDVESSKVVGTAAFFAMPHRGPGVVEIRKMYFDKSVRGRGLGSFLLSALEQRIFQLGYTHVFIETASVLKEACILYQKNGYLPSSGLETERCDIALAKQLYPLQPPSSEEHVEAIDMTRGWTVTCVTREQALDHRLLFRAVVVLVESRGQIFVHKRSMNKSTYPGLQAAFVTGGVDWMENPLETAKREVEEELGLTGLDFTKPFAPFISKGADGLGQRIQFHPYIARGDFCEDDVTCDPIEVECGEFMSRAEIILRGIGGSLWKEFRAHGL